MGGSTPDLIKAIAVCTIFGLAILAAVIYGLLEHQRKMAAILRSDLKQNEGLDERVDALQTEVRELKALLLNGRAALPAEADDVRRRIG